MKKFLSLVLSLVMTMSLVTVGAGATEYKDLTDKGEIQYEEAVAVLNKLGIITGYEDGSFKPTGALTRGAAAKIIVSLMIGPEAASSLVAAAAPYKDVPLTNTFASVISYCKTAGYINGYADGTFRPTGALTGFAFAKMLLGALGYDGAVEGFTGSGWTMKVASVGSKANLYKDITSFSGNAGVTREVACQLALNTLKGTEVEYDAKDIVVKGDGIDVSVGGSKAEAVIRIGEIKADNWDQTILGTAGDGLMQFAEEHFPDLKFTSSIAADDFGRPANTWTYKNVTVGTYAKKADFVFTASVGKSGDSDSDALKNLGIKGYTIASVPVYTNGAGNATAVTGGKALEDLTGNGTIVELFKGATADTIAAVVVRQPQLMQVSSVSSKTVSLKLVTSGVGVSAVKDDNDAFSVLSGMKVDDYVMVIPCKDSTGAAYTVSEAYAPTVVTGTLTGIYSNSNGTATNAVTVAGTKYSVAKVSEDLTTLAVGDVSNTKKDVTLYVDANGYATYIDEVGSSSDFLIYKSTYQSLVDGKLVKYVQGYDFSGNLISVNVGSTFDPTTLAYGTIYNYTTDSVTGDAEYRVISTPYTTGTAGSLTVYTAKKAFADLADNYEVKSSDTFVYDNSAVLTSGQTLAVNGAAARHTVASDVKTIFITWDGAVGTTAVKSVTVKNGVANVTNTELKGGTYTAQMYLNKDGAVKAIVVMGESSDAVSSNVLYINKLVSSDVISGTKTYVYEAYIDGAVQNITSTSPSNAIPNGRFAAYTEADGKYTLSQVTADSSATSAFSFTLGQNSLLSANNNLVNVDETNNDVKLYNDSASSGKLATTVLNLAGATWVDLTGNGITSGKTFKDCADLIGKTVVAKVIVNNKASNDNQYKVAQIVLTDTATVSALALGNVAATLTVSGSEATLVSATLVSALNASVTGEVGTLTVTVRAPGAAADKAAGDGLAVGDVITVSDDLATKTYTVVAP